MNDSLRDFLIEQDYTRVKLKQTKTNHLELKARINDVLGRFILDTGASNSCLGFESIEQFKLNAEDSKIKAAGAGATDMFTRIAKKNHIKIAKWKYKRLDLVLFDLSHVNSALTYHNAKPVDGIIGGDILKKAHAIIDYNKKYLYLKL
jgi:hypothetical protein